MKQKVADTQIIPPDLEIYTIIPEGWRMQKKGNMPTPPPFLPHFFVRKRRV